MSAAALDVQATTAEALVVSEQENAVCPVSNLCSVFGMSSLIVAPDFKTDGKEYANVKLLGYP